MSRNDYILKKISEIWEIDGKSEKLLDQIINNKVEEIINKNFRNLTAKVNTRISNIFDEATMQSMENVFVNTMTKSETYRKIKEGMNNLIEISSH